MEKKQQHTSELGSDEDLAIEVAYNTRLVHGRHGRHTETLKRTFINGATWMRERLLKRIEANEQRIASLTEQVEQARVNVEKIESAVYAARPDEDIIIKEIYRLTNKALSDLNTIPALTKKGE